MTVERQLRFWLIGLAIFLLALFFLRSILLPFVLGMAIAYLLDPACDRLVKLKLSRSLATALVLFGFFVLCLAIVMLLVPVLAAQVSELAKRAPGYIEVIKGYAAQGLAFVEAKSDDALMIQIEDALKGLSNELLAWVTTALKGLLSQGAAFANLLSLLIITPVVAFYLLRDWDDIVARVDSWMPRRHLGPLRQLSREVDATLAGFLRGQGAVCLLLGIFYAIGLTLAGLDFGLVIGLLAGLLTFIPYAGSIFGLVLSVGLALLQFDSLGRVGVVAVIFVVGQIAEGNFLTPKLVGESVGLHPVWIIFALLAGGALFGFVGILIAVPLAAIIGVGARFGMGLYLGSRFYEDGSGGTKNVPAGGDEG